MGASELEGKNKNYAITSNQPKNKTLKSIK